MIFIHLQIMEIYKPIKTENMEKLMKSKEIISSINGNGGMDVSQFNLKELRRFIFINYPCTRYTAEVVALYLLY